MERMSTLCGQNVDFILSKEYVQFPIGFRKYANYTLLYQVS
jgi:hypothetical protein